MKTDTPETDEAWDAVSRTPDGMYDSRVPIMEFALAMSHHSKKMELERDEARQAMRDANRATMDANTRAGMGETLPCNWHPNEDSQWASTCGEMLELTNDGPAENGFKHCPFCGNPISSLPPANENATP